MTFKVVRRHLRGKSCPLPATPRNRHLLVALTTAALIVVVSACGSSTKAGSVSASSSSTPTSGSSQSPSSAAPTTVSSSTGNSSAQVDTCSLLPLAEAESLAAQQYSSATPQTIASGQDQCTYASADQGADLVVIVYQPNSGVSFAMMKSVQNGVGPVAEVTGVGDQAIVGQIELDAQAGTRLVAVEGAGGLGSNEDRAVAVAKAVIVALH